MFIRSTYVSISIAKPSTPNRPSKYLFKIYTLTLKLISAVLTLINFILIWLDLLLLLQLLTQNQNVHTVNTTHSEMVFGLQIPSRNFSQSTYERKYMDHTPSRSFINFCQTMELWSWNPKVLSFRQAELEACQMHTSTI